MMMRRIAALALAAAIGFGAAPPAKAGELAGFEAIPLTGDLVFDLGGLDVEFLAGAFVKSVTTGGLLTVQTCNSFNTVCAESTVQIAVGGGSDGVLTGASFVQSTKVLTLTLSDGGPVTVTLTDLQTDTEVTAAINTAIANARATATPGNVVTGTGSVGTSTRLAREDHIHGGDQVGTPGGGIQSVATDTTLSGDGTAADPLGVADDGVDTTQLADDAVTQAKLANNSVHAAQIGANAVGTSEISANAVGTSELSADAVTNANLADDSVHNDQLASNSVRADEIQANAVGHVEMNDDSVGVDELITSNTPATSQVLGYDGSDMLWVAQTGGGGASAFVDLTDTPATITADECVQGNAAGDALVFAACATGGGRNRNGRAARRVRHLRGTLTTSLQHGHDPDPWRRPPR